MWVSRVPIKKTLFPATAHPGYKRSMSIPDFSHAEWRKSRHSGSNGCVEVASKEGMIAVRDSKDPAGAILVFRPDEWDAFVAGVLDGEFRLTS
jgi:hypothetical protein